MEVLETETVPDGNLFFLMVGWLVGRLVGWLVGLGGWLAWVVLFLRWGLLKGLLGSLRSLRSLRSLGIRVIQSH